MSAETQPQEPEKQELIKGELSFYLIDGITHVNLINAERSRIELIKNSLIENLNNEKGVLTIQGSPENAHDFYIIPKEHVCAIKFKVLQ